MHGCMYMHGFVCVEGFGDAGCDDCEKEIT